MVKNAPAFLMAMVNFFPWDKPIVYARRMKQGRKGVVCVRGNRGRYGRLIKVVRKLKKKMIRQANDRHGYKYSERSVGVNV
jgi:hypothetical protein